MEEYGAVPIGEATEPLTLEHLVETIFPIMIIIIPAPSTAEHFQAADFTTTAPSSAEHFQAADFTTAPAPSSAEHFQAADFTTTPAPSAAEYLYKMR